MKQQNNLTDSPWISLFASELMILTIFVCMTPVVGAFFLMRSGNVWMGAPLFTLGTIFDGWLLWKLHSHKHVRLMFSLPFAALCFAVCFLVAGAMQK